MYLGQLLHVYLRMSPGIYQLPEAGWSGEVSAHLGRLIFSEGQGRLRPTDFAQENEDSVYSTLYLCAIYLSFNLFSTGLLLFWNCADQTKPAGGSHLTCRPHICLVCFGQIIAFIFLAKGPSVLAICSIKFFTF